MNRIDKSTIAAAETLLGIAYSDGERTLMQDNLSGQIELAQQRRTIVFPNGYPTATRFDPRLPGFRPPEPQQPVSWTCRNQGPVPDDLEEIAYATVLELSHWIKAGTLTSRRLTEIYLARIDELAPTLECFVTVTAERARREADAMDSLLGSGTWLGPLHGIPYALKDLFDVRDVPTTWGAEPWVAQVATEDSTVATRLRDAGAVLLGKSTVGALAFGDIWFGGRTRNPWNLDEGASGSSAGSAAATAAGLCAFSIGTETLGSITSPSERCGTTGLRPTYGRVSRHGGMALCWSLDKVGPICRSVEDTGVVLAALNGGDLRDTGSIEMPFNHRADETWKPVRLGYLAEAYDSPDVTDLDREILETVRELGFAVSELRLQELPYDSLVSILFAESAACFEELTLTNRDDMLRRQDAEAWPNAFRKARFLSAVDHVQADRLRRRVMEELDNLFREIDVLVGPHSTGPMLVASNFTGHPCLHLRAGFENVSTRTEAPMGRNSTPGVERNLRVPRGLSLWSGLFEESRLIHLGMELESMFAVTAERPTFVSPRAIPSSPNP